VEIEPDVSLDLMEEGQEPARVVSRVIDHVVPLLRQMAPRAMIVQGDTSTVLGAALAAWYLRIPIAHVEAGLRTGDLGDPFPEEGNRQLVDRLATWLFAPTPLAATNLAAEGLPANRVEVTGNTAVDEILVAAQKGGTPLPPGTILVTLHRRESFGGPMEAILGGLGDFLAAVPEARAVWALHPNPEMRRLAASRTDLDRLSIVRPMSYLDFAAALRSCRMVLTDSGGVQEEAPTFGVPCLVARDVTERPEAVLAGSNRVVGRTREGVHDALLEAWAAPPWTGPVPAPNPYGDGRAAERVARRLEKDLCEQRMRKE